MSYVRLEEMDGVLYARATSHWPDTRLLKLYYDYADGLFAIIWKHVPDKTFKYTADDLLKLIGGHGGVIFSYDDVYSIGEFVRKINKSLDDNRKKE